MIVSTVQDLCKAIQIDEKLDYKQSLHMVDKELKRLQIKENIFDETLMEVLNDKELPDILEFFRINQYEMKTSKDDIYNDIMNFSEIKLDEIEKTLIEKDQMLDILEEIFLKNKLIQDLIAKNQKGHNDFILVCEAYKELEIVFEKVSDQIDDPDASFYQIMRKNIDKYHQYIEYLYQNQDQGILQDVNKFKQNQFQLQKGLSDIFQKFIMKQLTFLTDQIKVHNLNEMIINQIDENLEVTPINVENVDKFFSVQWKNLCSFNQIFDFLKQNLNHDNSNILQFQEHQIYIIKMNIFMYLDQYKQSDETVCQLEQKYFKQNDLKILHYQKNIKINSYFKQNQLELLQYKDAFYKEIKLISENPLKQYLINLQDLVFKRTEKLETIYKSLELIDNIDLNQVFLSFILNYSLSAYLLTLLHQDMDQYTHQYCIIISSIITFLKQSLISLFEICKPINTSQYYHIFQIFTLMQYNLKNGLENLD